jgi:hypothetical protein
MWAEYSTALSHIYWTPSACASESDAISVPRMNCVDSIFRAAWMRASNDLTT